MNFSESPIESLSSLNNKSGSNSSMRFKMSLSILKQMKGNKVSHEAFREAIRPKQEGVDSRFDVGQYFKDSLDISAK